MEVPSSTVSCIFYCLSIRGLTCCLAQGLPRTRRSQSLWSLRTRVLTRLSCAPLSSRPGVLLLTHTAACLCSPMSSSTSRGQTRLFSLISPRTRTSKCTAVSSPRTSCTNPSTRVLRALLTPLLSEGRPTRSTMLLSARWRITTPRPSHLSDIAWARR